MSAVKPIGRVETQRRYNVKRALQNKQRKAALESCINALALQEARLATAKQLLLEFLMISEMRKGIGPLMNETRAFLAGEPQR